jgi:hypothetical protein
MIPLRSPFDGAELALPRPHTAARGAIPGDARAKDLRPRCIDGARLRGHSARRSGQICRFPGLIRTP